MTGTCREVIAATKNEGKIIEIRAALAGTNYIVGSLAEGDSLPSAPETGVTFQENACQKARYYLNITGKACLADDSGLEVDALNGAPGVYSARYAGEEASDADNNQKLLAALRDVPPEKRTARFRCALALTLPGGRELTAEGTVEGVILSEARGTGGFGYDPLFYVAELGKTMAELSPEEKNRISHRGKALRRLAAQLAGD